MEPLKTPWIRIDPSWNLSKLHGSEMTLHGTPQNSMDQNRPFMEPEWCKSYYYRVGIFQLYLGSQFYWCRKLEYPEKPTDLSTVINERKDILKKYVENNDK
jgi:hypothetical protein